MTMRVALFVSCLVDQMWPDAGVATVEVLRRAGCEVEFDPRQTCCSQPAFNAGYREDARRVARHFVDVMSDAAGDTDAIVVPSGSCCAMVKRLPELLAGEPREAAARAVAQRTHEFASFLVQELGVESVGGRYDGRVTWHDACHGLRELGIREAPRRLIRAVEGVEFVEMPGAESCCGFGGTFAVEHADLSVAVLDSKLKGLAELGVDTLVSGDVSCLMQIDGRLRRLEMPVRGLHLAELLVGQG